ncbi:hypothetical protein U1Q18_005535 [Sarracenia purpurea var. burkii]
MSCNGCRALRKACGESCVLRPSLQWIDSPQAQINATLFVSKFFGRSDLMSFISAVPEDKRPALFQSLLFEACGRTVNPVNGAVGLLSTGNWHICQAAVQTVLDGGTLRPITAGIYAINEDSEDFDSDTILEIQKWYCNSNHEMSPAPSFGGGRGGGGTKQRTAVTTMSFDSEESEMMMMMMMMKSYEGGDYGVKKLNRVEEPKLLNLFV